MTAWKIEPQGDDEYDFPCHADWKDAVEKHFETLPRGAKSDLCRAVHCGTNELADVLRHVRDGGRKASYLVTRINRHLGWAPPKLAGTSRATNLELGMASLNDEGMVLLDYVLNLIVENPALVRSFIEMTSKLVAAAK